MARKKREFKCINECVAQAPISENKKLDGLSLKEILTEKDRLRNILNKYIDSKHLRFSKIRTLLYRNKSVDLKDHYVAGDLRRSDSRESISSTNLISAIHKTKRIIISGTAGSGKSILMRKLFLDFCENESCTIPILIELRILALGESKKIEEHLQESLREIDEKFDEKDLEWLLRSGVVTLLLDGFDEIDYKRSDRYEKEIIDISNRFQDINIVVSSRPDGNFESWENFEIFFTQPLKKEQSIELISKIDYETLVKESFIKELNNKLYDKHTGFLSNPLLLTMMLLTFEQLAEIPDKIHIFYEQAFETLYNKHDALKELYKRHSYCNLPSDDFKRLLSAFCLVTFTERAFKFTKEKAIEYIATSKKIEDRINANSESFFQDLLKNVCILQRDGLNYQFSHRSFQEYFCARFLIEHDLSLLDEILDELLIFGFRDEVLNLIFAMNREKLEREWLLPKIEKYKQEIDNALEKEGLTGFYNLLYSGVNLHISDGNRRLGFTLEDEKPIAHFMIFISQRYGEEIEKIPNIDSKITANPDDIEIEKDAIYLSENYDSEDTGLHIKFSIIKDEINQLTTFKKHAYHSIDLLKFLEIHIKQSHKNRKNSIEKLIKDSKKIKKHIDID